MSKKILFITTGTKITASSRARVYNYKPFLEKTGFTVTIIPYNCFIDARLNAMNKKRGLIIKLINKINHFFKCLVYITIVSLYDVVFLQRVLLPRGVFKFIRVLSKNIIFDFDDAIYLADRWNSFFLNRHKFFKRFQYILKTSDCVIVSNEALKEVASKFNSNVIILPTPVDTQRLTPKSQRYCDGRVVIGWIGSPEATSYVQPLKRIFEALAKRYPFLKMTLVGAASLPDWGIDMTIKQWSLEEEVKDLQSFDIGIMPLDDDEWSSAKGGYKLLQYMAVGIPCVASAVGINKEIITEGITGFLVTTPEDWLEKLSILIEDPKLRTRIGAEGRKKVQALYSYQSNITKLISVLRNV